MDRIDTGEEQRKKGEKKGVEGQDKDIGEK